MDVSCGLGVGIAFGIFFSQMGYERTNLLCRLLSDVCAMEALPYAAKLAIALFMGASASVLGLVAGIDLRRVILTSLQHAKCGEKAIGTALKDIFVTLLAVSSSVIAGTALASAVKIMTENPNLFGIDAGSLPAYLLIGGNWIFSAAFDLYSLMSLIAKPKASFEHAVQWIEKNKLPQETVRNLKACGLFKSQVLKIKQEISSGLCLTSPRFEFNGTIR